MGWRSVVRAGGVWRRWERDSRWLAGSQESLASCEPFSLSEPPVSFSADGGANFTMG